MKKTYFILPLLLGSSLCAHAIERPGLDQDENLPAVQNEENPQNKAEAQELPEAQESMPWLGVGGNPISEDLAWHLNLEGGVMLELVAPDSPAAKSGLQARDIITSVDGQAVDSQDDLRAAILKRQTGEEVKLGLIQKGKISDKKVTLAARPHDLPLIPMPQFGQNLNALPEGMPDVLRQEIERKMRNLQVPQLGAGQGNFKELEQKLNEMLKDMPEDKNNFGLNFKTQSTMLFKDAEGSVELKTVNGGKEVTIRDLNDQILFEGPYDSEQDKTAVPDIYQERLKKLNLKDSALKFHFRGLNQPKDKNGNIE